MIGQKIVIKRLLQEWIMQWKVIQSVVDFWILLYIVVPAAILLPVLYHELWQNVNRYWSPLLPLTFLLYVMLFLSSGGNFRTYLFKADQLFLLQKTTVIHQIKQCALFLSLIHRLLVTVLIYVVALPILIRAFHFDATSIICLFIMFIAYQLIVLTLKKYIRRLLYQKIILFFMLGSASALLSICTPLINGMVGGIIVISMIGILFNQAKSTRAFTRELDIEESERNKYVHLIMGFSMTSEKVPMIRNRKPLILFRNSKRMFKVRSQANGLLEVVLKVFLRDASLIKSYFTFILLTSIAILLIPFWAKWILLAAFFFFMKFWLNIAFKRIIDHNFFYVVPYARSIEGEVWARFKRWVTYPSLAWLGGILSILSLVKLLT
ncbi:ABC transporter permease [Sporolactobacillus sp. STCC-11]|uniref:ABC transporter permease n=1 Tax=Sporolactobacillus caesalpiniae TaxID=3230362 RepID=UPI003391955D